MASGISGDLSWELEIDGDFSVKSNPDGVLFGDGNSYNRATDTTVVKSTHIAFKIKLRRTGLDRILEGEWGTVVDIKKGASGWTRGDLKIQLKGG